LLNCLDRLPFAFGVSGDWYQWSVGVHFSRLAFIDATLHWFLSLFLYLGDRFPFAFGVSGDWDRWSLGVNLSRLAFIDATLHWRFFVLLCLLPLP
jgi:hypothetical protein